MLLRKFVAYRDLQAAGIYQRVFGGPILLIVVAQTARRAGLLATEFRRAWPGGWGVVSLPTHAAAFHPEHGALWGVYRSLADGQPFPLLTELSVTHDGRLTTRPAVLGG